MDKIINTTYFVIVAIVITMVLTISGGVFYAAGTGLTLLVLSELLFARMRRMRRITEMRNRTKNFHVVGMHPYPTPERQVAIFEDYPGLLTVVPHNLVYKTAKALETELSEVGNCNGLPKKDGSRWPASVRRYIMGEGEFAGESWAAYMLRVEMEVAKDMQIESKTQKQTSEAWELEKLAGQEMENSTHWMNVIYSGKKKQKI